jgi:HPt (histidine-containing phosphotransfer) domain-containing protein
MKSLLADGSGAELARESHSLAGASGLVFAPLPRELFLSLETECKSQRLDSAAELIEQAFKLQEKLAQQIIDRLVP